ncbi:MULTISPECIES: hypothetical protein [unclassified Streptomyces]|uniref:hypothetical protein n=1 Tax=unclassified Streptomyces TaxID=2593676 RepID=UPI00093CC458|nr:hypothetical protein [Streptomyces sp. CB02058]OKI96239.1 hypothetical protein AMK10_11455 [Streptomyces sp. CB02058]
MSTGRPLRTRERVLVRIAVVFVLLVALGGGAGLAAEGLEGRAALRDGPVGALAPTDRQCGKESCTWIGTFTSADGRVTERDVDLRDDVEVSRGEAMPGTIDGVRLAEDSETAYTTDYGWRAPLAKGAAMAAVGLAIAAGLILMLRSRGRAAVSP